MPGALTRRENKRRRHRQEKTTEDVETHQLRCHVGKTECPGLVETTRSRERGKEQILQFPGGPNAADSLMATVRAFRTTKIHFP